ncbi:MAG: DUF1178 family protein [Rhodospirillales bacterium]|nr:DUF1178 family protein [Rhodospirillales bacterium]MCW8863162.1 DUF1178 family protein [Rhodospirillales bacterium]MCW8952790.1 DUF1178 family protein [Rhodospirillales bacterium]MCW8971554.1 DUF1178 family protein [Rhodospirillales bacterium]MCW9001129.1 DUF1178 family protein [Rhodospirillales bacterium]
MILYRLRCANAHDFEAWFRNSATYDAQAAGGEVECPYCGDTAIHKAPMAPRVLTSRSSEPAAPSIEKSTEGAGNPEKGGEARAAEVAREILNAIEKLRDQIESNADYVGDRFAKEARAIHYGDSEERPIYGEASDKEAEDLAEEGVKIARLPWSKRRRDS